MRIFEPQHMHACLRRCESPQNTSAPLPPDIPVEALVIEATERPVESLLGSGPRKVAVVRCGYLTNQPQGYPLDRPGSTSPPGAILSSHAERSWGFRATVLVGPYISRVYLGSRRMPKRQTLERVSDLAPNCRRSWFSVIQPPKDAGYCGPARPRPFGPTSARTSVHLPTAL